MTDNSQKFEWRDFFGLSENDIEEKVKQFLSKMSLKQKARQMSGDKFILSGILPMAIRYNKNPIVAGEDKELGIPGIKFSDGPRGVVIGNSTCFPVSIARGASFDIKLEEEIGNIIGIEARAQGANYFGGVCINLIRHPSWGRSQETYGEDPFHLGEMGSALVRGTQKHVMACAKHYAANSMENSRFKVSVEIAERTLREVYLPHFKRCVDEGVASIMNAYNKVNGEYCGHNKHLLTDILKDDWQFKGFVITDFIRGIRKGKLAVKAGVDIEMPFNWKMMPSKLVKWVKKGIISEQDIDDSVMRILRQKIKFAKKEDENLYIKDKIACDEHIKVALEAARKSIVLLKNDNQILPINRKNIKKIAIFGKLADKANTGDHGSSRVYPPYVITPLEGIKKIAGHDIEVIYDKGKNIEKAKELAKSVDLVVIVVGFTHKEEGEYVLTHGGDRVNLNLKSRDEELISNIFKENDNCIVVLEAGSAVIMENWKNKVPAILMAWYPGMEGGTAIAEIIFGDINPCAKLPLTFPKSIDQLPYFKKDTKSIEYEYYHGYKLLEKNNQEPAFPFGFGLSYTSYSYKNLRLDNNSIGIEDEITVSVDISNTGKVSGEEIVQLYVGYENSSVDRSKKDLKGFGKLKLNPNQTKTLDLKLKAKDLAYYDIKSNEWIVEKGKYNVQVGASSKSVDLLTISFKIV